MAKAGCVRRSNLEERPAGTSLSGLSGGQAKLQETQRVASQPVQRGHHQDVSGLYNVQQIVQARSLEHGPRDDVLVDTAGDADAGGAGEPQPLILQGVGPVIPAAGYADVTLNRPGSVTPEHAN